MTIYFGTHFDELPDWNGCCDPPEPLSKYGYNNDTYCNHMSISDTYGDAHGSIGKCARIEWYDSIREMGIETWAAANKEEIWIGYWWRHDTGFTMPEQDKWIYLPEVAGVRTMFSHHNNTIGWYNGGAYELHVNIGDEPNNHPDTSQSSWYNDVLWHYFVIHASPKDNSIRIWRDGIELDWDNDNMNAGWLGTHFDDSAMLWGYQSRNGWAGHVSYFDDCVIASSKEEVEDFLGVSTSLPSDEVVIPGEEYIIPPTPFGELKLLLWKSCLDNDNCQSEISYWGSTVTITATISNTGDGSGSFGIQLINKTTGGTLSESSFVDIGSGESLDISSSFVMPVIDLLTVKVILLEV